MTTRRSNAAPPFRVALTAVAAVALVCVLGVQRGVAATWRDTASPNDGGYNTLRAVSSSSVNDAWAVGVAFGARAHAPIAEHWNGTAWTGFTPPFAGDGGALTGVVDVASNDAWAVGYSVSESGASSPLAERWNGSAWVQQTVPHRHGYHAALSGIAAVSPSVRWAVGDRAKAGSARASYAIVWNGSAWADVATPNVADANNVLLGVSGIAPSDVWAVGYAATGANAQALTEHFDGHAWSIVANPTASGSGLLAVSGTGSSDVWAVGSRVDGGGSAALAEHWNGVRWSVVKADERTSGGGDQFSSVAPVPGTADFWAVGGTFDAGGTWAATVTQRLTRATAAPPHPEIPRRPGI